MSRLLFDTEAPPGGNALRSSAPAASVVIIRHGGAALVANRNLLDAGPVANS